MLPSSCRSRRGVGEVTEIRSEEAEQGGVEHADGHQSDSWKSSIGGEVIFCFSLSPNFHFLISIRTRRKRSFPLCSPHIPYVQAKPTSVISLPLLSVSSFS
ncbi:hypothetical protein ACFX1X_032585 [Malus domestica]